MIFFGRKFDCLVSSTHQTLYSYRRVSANTGHCKFQESGHCKFQESEHFFLNAVVTCSTSVANNTSITQHYLALPSITRLYCYSSCDRGANQSISPLHICMKRIAENIFTWLQTFDAICTQQPIFVLSSRALISCTGLPSMTSTYPMVGAWYRLLAGPCQCSMKI